MLHASMDLLFFSAKFLITIIMLLLLLAGILLLASRKRGKIQGTLRITNLNKHFTDAKNTLLAEILPKAEFRKHQKKLEKKCKQAEAKEQQTLFVLNFNGDIRASAVSALREEVTAILGVATPRDEVILRLESAGGMVHAYGLATAQLQRLRDHGIPLTVAVDKMAASGGYMMACLADRLIAAPFAIVGSIGVILQLPNFSRLLKENHVDFEQITAGRYKRTLSLLGPITTEGREKSREEVEAIHTLFQQLVHKNRKDIDIEKVTTGEHWTGSEALLLNLVDQLGTSDDYLLSHADTMRILEVRYQQKKTLAEKFISSKNQLLTSVQHASLPW